MLKKPGKNHLQVEAMNWQKSIDKLKSRPKLARRAVSLLLVGALLLVAAPVFAANGDAAQAEFPWAYWATSVLNLLIFLAIIYKFGGPGINGYFKARREKLIENLDQAKVLREEAEARLEEYSARLDALEDERKALLEEYHQQGERERDRIIADAKKQIEKMRADAEISIDQEVKKAVASLEQQVVAHAVERAEALAKEKVDAASQKQLVDDYVSELHTMEPPADSERAA